VGEKIGTGVLVSVASGNGVEVDRRVAVGVSVREGSAVASAGNVTVLTLNKSPGSNPCRFRPEVQPLSNSSNITTASNFELCLSQNPSGNACVFPLSDDA